MERVSLAKSACPVARGLERIGEWWSILILRDASNGLSRFDEFQRNLGIAPNMLTRRLKSLVAAGLLEKRKYCERPARFEYVLTERGRDFQPVLWALVAWGNKHFSPEGPNMVVVDRETGNWAEPILVDARSGKKMTRGEYINVAGPASKKPFRAKYPYVSLKSGSPLERNDEAGFNGLRFRGEANE